ncbi:hypothetical protein [Pedobacter sp. MW01-1-1]|uniref:hypothetical protein n=1 Tax=Pedobacter sp. MW01-1-1 TaxID=3383027 RepID=UPI003FED487B
MEIRNLFLALTIGMLIYGCNRNKKVNIAYGRVQSMVDIVDTLTLSKKMAVHIYCTGELKPEWSNVGRQYIGQSDDIEIFYRRRNNKENKIVFKSSDRKKDTLNQVINHVKCFRTYDKHLRKYLALVTIPCALVLDQAVPGRWFEFDVAIGDNDDGIKQKAKLCWAANTDPLSQKAFLGRMILAGRGKVSPKDSVAVARNISNLTTELADCPRYSIKKLVAGQVNDEADFSAFYRAAWDRDNIYLSFEIFDSKNEQFRKENLVKDDNFVDKGWIEDINGKKIWQMSLLNTKHGGGALKNQYCDTILSLSTGKYIVKYTSDESHSWNNWDAEQPHLKFWGIKITQ